MIKARHTYDFGMIGNCSFLSYIDKRANIVWQCWPHFDSDFVFGSLIAGEKGGEFSISPADDDYSSKQYYVKNTNVLVTEFYCKSGAFKVIDFAPRFGLYERWHKPLKVFRKIQKISGNPVIKVVCNPVSQYGEVKAEANLGGSNHITYTNLPFRLRLTTNVSLSDIIKEKSFLLTEDKYLVLSYNSKMELPLKSTFEDFLQKTKDYWKTWIRHATLPNYFQSEVIRSALILKLHQYEDTGAIIASGTTSLPEHPKAGRNWDYRYCWMRDAYFTLAALNSLSHFDEMEAYAHYIQNVFINAGDIMQPVYTIDGTASITENEINVSGYKDNKPVRIGNAAYHQIQNDVYGQVILSILPLFIDERIKWDSDSLLEMVEKLLQKIDETLDQPDAGIWEYRAMKQLHTGTLIFHWAGIKAVIKIAKQLEQESLLKKAEELLARAKKNIEDCFDQGDQAYKAYSGGDHYNASELLLITMNYLKDSPQRAEKHLEVLEKNLKSEEGFIYRYRARDDFGDTHSAFMICGFWYAEALADVGRLEDAQELFEKLISTSNHLGILSEDIDPTDSSQWGNFAQTYSHVGLINTAFKINSKLDKLIFE
ncbi:MAG: glycosyl hydrolase [Halobacteriovoraceae bacterium]|nr:glycosyl hydrolase [Halobacteriovoraceae bacterium]|tara:strand:+ start:25836 stop:27623 length:1788 start_codon:yes stop_codon:yes gene_type:complete